MLAQPWSGFARLGDRRMEDRIRCVQHARGGFFSRPSSRFPRARSRCLCNGLRRMPRRRSRLGVEGRRRRLGGVERASVGGGAAHQQLRSGHRHERVLRVFRRLPRAERSRAGRRLREAPRGLRRRRVSEHRGHRPVRPRDRRVAELLRKWRRGVRRGARAEGVRGILQGDVELVPLSAHAAAEDEPLARGALHDIQHNLERLERAPQPGPVAARARDRTAGLLDSVGVFVARLPGRSRRGRAGIDRRRPHQAPEVRSIETGAARRFRHVSAGGA